MLMTLDDDEFEVAGMHFPQKPKWKTRLMQGGFPDRSFDIEFWQEQGNEAIFARQLGNWLN